MDVISLRIQLSLNWLHKRGGERGKMPPRTSPLLLRPGGISCGGMKDSHLIFLSGGTNTKVVLNKKRRKTLRWEKKTEEEFFGFFWCFGVRMSADSIGISLLQRRKNLPDSLLPTLLLLLFHFDRRRIKIYDFFFFLNRKTKQRRSCWSLKTSLKKQANSLI